VAFLFDTNAISELFRREPNTDFVAWVGRLPREEQFTSVVVVAELLAGAEASPAPAKWCKRIHEAVLPRITVLPMDLEVAAEFGRVKARLTRQGTPIGDTDSFIAATAVRYDLTMVTANLNNMSQVSGLRLHPFEPGAR